jgi:Phage tail protein (Tail_P2_I)
MDTATAWATGKPVYSRLPGINEGYRKDEDPNVIRDDPEELPIAKWLTDFWDALLVAKKAQLDDIKNRQMNPLECDPEWLDLLAVMAGFTGEYWDKSWPVEVKRQLVFHAFTLIWANKGSEAVLRFLLDTFGINYDIWMGDQFLAGIDGAGSEVGAPQWRYVIRVGLEYLRNSDQFKLAEKLNRLYGPLFTDNRVAFKQFYAGFSIAGDPVFRREQAL